MAQPLWTTQEANAEAQGPVTAKRHAHETSTISTIKAAKREAKGKRKVADDEDEEMDDEEGMPMCKKKKVGFEDEEMINETEEGE